MVYGLAGEAMLNFGLVLAPLAFFILGLATARTKMLMVNLVPNDSRLLLLPYLINLCVLILVADSDNILYFFIVNGSLPFAVLFLSSKILVTRRTNSFNGSYWVSDGRKS